MAHADLIKEWMMEYQAAVENGEIDPKKVPLDDYLADREGSLIDAALAQYDSWDRDTGKTND